MPEQKLNVIRVILKNIVKKWRIKLIGKFGMERVWKIFISEKYGKYVKEYLNWNVLNIESVKIIGSRNVKYG